MMRKLRALDREYAVSARTFQRPKRAATSRRHNAIVIGGVGLLCWGMWQLGVFSMWADDIGGTINSHSAPLGRAWTADAGDYSFQHTRPHANGPVGYDPCKPIHYVVNPRTAFKGSIAIRETAIKQIKAATGIHFVFDGWTDEAPSKKPRTAAHPVLLAWSDPAESPRLKGSIAGLGGSQPALVGNTWFLVSGTIWLDGPQLQQIRDSPGGARSARAVIMHELGHLLGLAHVDAPDQIMHHKGSAAIVDWGSGDLKGLSILGSVKCS